MLTSHSQLFVGHHEHFNENKQEDDKSYKHHSSIQRPEDKDKPDDASSDKKRDEEIGEKDDPIGDVLDHQKSKFVDLGM